MVVIEEKVTITELIGYRLNLLLQCSYCYHVRISRSGVNAPALVAFIALDECLCLLPIPTVESSSFGDTLVMLSQELLLVLLLVSAV